MIAGISFSAESAVKVEKKVALTATVDVDIQTKVHAIASASVSCLAETRAQLLATGEIKIEDEPDLEDDLLEEEEEGEFDSSDEDEFRNEDSHEEMKIVSNPYSGVFRRDSFEIKVVEVGGEWRCEIPQSGWEGIVGVKPFGEKAVYTVSTRMQVYLLVAMWIEETHQEFLRKGPFISTLPLCSQKRVLEECKPLWNLIGGTKDGGVSSLSRYLKNVDIVWPEGVLPLNKCFGG